MIRIDYKLISVNEEVIIEGQQCKINEIDIQIYFKIMKKNHEELIQQGIKGGLISENSTGSEISKDLYEIEKGAKSEEEKRLLNMLAKLSNDQIQKLAE
jgi:hypothetical protein